jgi:hypothetical protein
LESLIQNLCNGSGPTGRFIPSGSQPSTHSVRPFRGDWRRRVTSLPSFAPPHDGGRPSCSPTAACQAKAKVEPGRLTQHLGRICCRGLAQRRVRGLAQLHIAGGRKSGKHLPPLSPPPFSARARGGGGGCCCSCRLPPPCPRVCPRRLGAAGEHSPAAYKEFSPRSRRRPSSSRLDWRFGASSVVTW